VSELPTRLAPKDIEPRLYREWNDAGRFHARPEDVLEDGADPYVIVIPPPNVTAVLHMGHGLNNTIQDVLIRWRRMCGDAALWIPGTDHAGIATQNVVERQLAREGKTRDDLGRDAFVERVWSFVDETGATILDQLKAIGASCDWDRTRFTLDPGLSTSVREVFVQLYERDLIYRAKYIINWCPRCLTALSNEEAEGREVDGSLWSFRYPFAPEAASGAATAAAAGAEAVVQMEDGHWYLTVSTTRPETMLGDMAVAVHPDDARYSAIHGAEVLLPLTDRRIRVIADEFVDPEFGTGMVKVTPAHDPNDFDMARRAELEPLEIFDEHAATNDNVPEAFRGLDRKAARKAVLAALDGQGLMAGSEVHRHGVPHCYRCDTVVEPRLSLQWFVRMEPLAAPAMQAVRDGTVTFTPDRWTKVYEHWLENIRDWCISRQLWWGHRIPVWYCDDCEETLVAREDPDACGACGSQNLRQDPDVLDTWFSSWLWPFSVFGWPEKTRDLEVFYPTQTLATAPEILFFWVARMIMSGYAFMGEAPFTHVYLHGTVRDAKGRKMSKSLGNGIDPLEVVDRFGADALRWTLITSCGVGTDIHLDHEDLEAAFAPGRNFANKVWNAGRFTLMTVGPEPVKPLSEVADELTIPDRWILARASFSAREVGRLFSEFRFHEVAEVLHRVFWSEFADWYLELVKPRLRGESGPESREVARSALVHVLDELLRALHPAIPFVTSELWAQLPPVEGGNRPESLIVAEWPGSPAADAVDRLLYDGAFGSPEADEAMVRLQAIVTEIRSLRKEYGVGEGAEVDAEVRPGSPGSKTALSELRPSVELLSKARLTVVTTDGTTDPAPAQASGPGAHGVLEDGTEIFVPLAGLIDLDQERERIGSELERLGAQLQGVQGRLANEQFVSRAPAGVVDGARAQAASISDQMERLREKLSRFGGAT